MNKPYQVAEGTPGVSVKRAPVTRRSQDEALGEREARRDATMSTATVVREPVRFSILVMLIALAALSCSCGGGVHSSQHSALPSSLAARGEPFVGYWHWSDPIAPAQEYLEIDGTPQGYAASWSDGPSVAVPLRNGRLLLQQLVGSPAATVFRPRLEVAWKDGTDVLVLTAETGAVPTSEPLRRLTKMAWAAGVTSFGDELTRYNCSDLGAGILAWTLHHGRPPSPNQMRAGSPFARWMAKHSLGQWPTNPFSGMLMRQSTTSLGDFTYRVDGTTWRLVGHLSDQQIAVEDESHV